MRSSRVLAVGTGVRIVVSPVIMALLLSHSYTVAAVVFVVAAATDWFDGRLARALERHHQARVVPGHHRRQAARHHGARSRWWRSAAPRPGWRSSSSPASSRSWACAAPSQPAGAVCRPRCWASGRRRVQFVAVALAMLRPDMHVRRRLPRPVGDGDRRRRHRLVGRSTTSAAPPPPCALRTAMARVFVTGGTGVIGRALVERLRGARRRGRRAGALGRGERAKLRARGCEVARGEVFDVDAMAAAWRDARWPTTSPGVNTLCRRPGADAPRQRRRRRGRGARGRRAGVPRLVSPRRRRRSARRPGRSATMDSPHRGWYLSTYERTKTEGERAAMAAARERRAGRRLRQPLVGAGAGRASGTGRILLARLDGTPARVRQHRHEPRRHRRLRRGPPAGRRARRPGERYVLSGATLTVSEALELVSPRWPACERNAAACCRAAPAAAAAVVEDAFRLRGRSRRCAARWSARCCTGTATTARAPSASSASRYTTDAETVRRTVEWARSEGLLRNV